MANRIALVLGATGTIGGAVARRLQGRGWQVRALHRTATGNRAGDWQWLRGDAMNRDDVVAAARGVDAIVHAVNPPGYRHWDKLALPMLDNAIAAARASGARLLLPGNVYNFGPDAFPVIDETAPQHPTTRKGAVRVAMEQRLSDAAADGVRSLVVRAGDFFGGGGSSSWFSHVIVKPGRPVRGIVVPWRDGVGHQWAYVPDLAETMARLLKRSAELPTFAVFHSAGHWDADGTALVSAIGRAICRDRLRVRRFPWPVVRLMAPVVPIFRELAEMRYLWEVPLRLDNSRLRAVLGEEPQTPLDLAVSRTLGEMGCIATPEIGATGCPAPDEAARPR